MKKTPKILPTYYKSKGTPIFRDTTALPFDQGGRISFEPSGYASIDSVHYADGGPIYTYDKRPGSYYQKTPQGWMISNAGTNNQYVPIDDPTGERTRILNQNAVVYNAPVQGAPNIVPAPIRTQQVAAQKNSPVIAQQQAYKQAQKQQKALDSSIAQQQAFDQSLEKTKLQSVQPADWVFAAPMAAPLAVEGLGAAMSIPLGGGVTTGGVAGAAGAVHGATQIDDRYQDWQDVNAGNMDWKEAALKTGLTGLDLAGGILPLQNASKIIKGLNSPVVKKGRTLVTADAVGSSAPKKIMGTIDEYGDFIDESGVTVYGESSPIGGNTTKLQSGLFNSEAPAIDLSDWEKAKKTAETGNERFIIPKGEQDFLVNKYTQEFADKFNIPVDRINPKDVGLYGKLKEAEFIPTREPIPVTERKFMPALSKEMHSDFLQTHNPALDLTKEEELVLDAYARGYDRLINAREEERAAAFYQNDIAPMLEQTILKNKFQQPQTLIRGTTDFDITDGASVIRDGQTLEDLRFSNLQEGDLFVPNSFTSASITKAKPQTSLGFEAPLTGFTQRSKNLDYVINAPAGQSYMYPNASNILHFPDEMEAILPKNLQFKLDKVTSDAERGYLGTADDIQKGVVYNGFTKMPSKYLPSISRFDKIVDLKGNKIPKKNIPNLIDYHNRMHQPTIPKYYFSIANPYLYGGMLNKKC